MTIEELSKKLNISISNIRTNFPRVYKKFLDQGIKIERERKYPNTIYNILYLPNNEEIEKEFQNAKSVKGKPCVIIAKTIKGKDVSFMENQVGWHGTAPNKEQYEVAMQDLNKILAGLEAE